jgi:hypothetical protein
MWARVHRVANFNTAEAVAVSVGSSNRQQKYEHHHLQPFLVDSSRQLGMKM